NTGCAIDTWNLLFLGPLSSFVLRPSSLRAHLDTRSMNGLRLCWGVRVRPVIDLMPPKACLSPVIRVKSLGLKPMAINVSIVEDDDGIRESLSVLLNGSENIRCISLHRSAEEAIKQIPLKKPDVILMDINLPGMSGIDCVRKLKTTLPKTQILM